MRFILATVGAVLGLGAAGCGEYYYGGAADYPESYRQDPATQQGAPGTVAAIGNASGVDNNAQAEGSAGQDVMVGQTDDYGDTDPSALTDFKSTLDPYGSWSDDATYGTVWQPSADVVGADFAPYVTGGHWAYDDDYVWVSDYDWGWAPFHYGRWVYVTGRGWCWIPGRRYAGAWVSWRYGGPDYGYVGWGPLPPSWYWRDGYAWDLGFAVYTPYTFCGRGDLFHPQVGGRVVAGPQVATVAAGTHVYVPSNNHDGRTPADPHVGEPLGGAGHKMPLGPSPDMLGYAAHSTPKPPIDNPGLIRAQQFSHGSTATALGARAPQMASRPTPAQYPPSGAINGANRPVATAPQYNYPNGTHYAPPAYRGPTYYPPAHSGAGVRQTPMAPTYPLNRGPSYASQPPVYRGPSPSAPPNRGAPSSPAYRSAPTAPSYHSAPSAPSHSAPSYRVAPAYHPPSYSSSSSSHSYSPSHSSGGGRHR